MDTLADWIYNQFKEYQQKKGHSPTNEDRLEKIDYLIKCYTLECLFKIEKHLEKIARRI